LGDTLASIRPAAIKTAHVKIRPRVRFSGTKRLVDYRTDCPGCGLIVQGQSEYAVKRTAALHYEDCAAYRKHIAAEQTKAEAKVVKSKVKAKTAKATKKVAADDAAPVAEAS
jgi:hypothetical protein